MKEIQLSQGKVALVDDEEFESLNQYKWHAQKNRNIFYAVRNKGVAGKRAIQYMHVVIMGRKGVDHIDRNGLNNQRNNLRFCTQSENCMNRSKGENCTSIYKGVCFHKQHKKWITKIHINGQDIHLGLFNTEVEAAKAYNAKAIELFLEFANLNIIPNE